MNNEGKDLFFCISIPALESYKKLESNPAIPTPYQRMKFLSEVYNQGIDTFLTIKPLCPTEYIPIDEALKIIEECKNYSTVVLSSGIVVVSVFPFFQHSMPAVQYVKKMRHKGNNDDDNISK